MKNAREETKETWAKGGYVGEVQNAYSLGGITVLDQVIEQLTYETYENEYLTEGEIDA